MSDVWMTPAEWAALELFGIPDRRGLHARATREGWTRRKRAGRGGGWEYPLSALPEAARLDYATRMVAKAAEAMPTDILVPARAKTTAKTAARPVKSVTQLAPAALAVAEARLVVLRAWWAFKDAAGLVDNKARPAFVAAWRAGQITVEPRVKEAVKGLSRATLYNWEAAYKDSGLSGLAPTYGNRAGSGLMDSDQDLRDFVLGLLVQAPHTSSATLMSGLRARFPGRQLPHYRTVSKWLAKWKADNAQLFLKVVNPDAWRSKYKSASGSQSEGIIRLNQVWELDSTPADLLLTDNYRHKIIGCIDVYPRRVTLHVSRQSTAAAVASCLRKSITAWGVPETVRIDNGADYISKHMRRVYDGLGIETDICPPFTPECKPHIERFFKSFSHDLLELLPGFVGHNVAERKDIEARKSFADRLCRKDEVVELRITPEELQKFCDEWCENVYQHRPHGGLNGKTPFEVAAANTLPIRRIENERALDILLLPTDGDGLRTVTKKGLRIGNAIYIAACLGGLEGQQVRVLFDEADAGRVYVFEAEAGTYIGVAENPDLTGVSRTDIAQARKARQAKVLTEGVKALRKASRGITPQQVAAEIMRHKAIEAGKLVALPQASEPYTSDALEQAAIAVRMDQAPQPRPLTEDEQARLTALEAELPTAEVVPLPLPPKDTRETRFSRALQLEGQTTPLTEEDRRWLAVYQTQPEYRAMRTMYEDFGDAVLTA